MYRRILIATDGSELANKAVTHGISLAKNLKSPVVIVTVTRPWSAFDLGLASNEGSHNPLALYEKWTVDSANLILEAAAQIAKSQGVAYEAVHVKDKHPAEGIIAATNDKDCDVIVMGSHGRRGFDRLLIGSQANEVVTHSKVPVLIVR